MLGSSSFLAHIRAFGAQDASLSQNYSRSLFFLSYFYSSLSNLIQKMSITVSKKIFGFASPVPQNTDVSTPLRLIFRAK